MDLCADLMASHMEMRDRGLRIRAMKRKGDAITKKSTDDDGTVMMENPTRAAVEMTARKDDEERGAAGAGSATDKSVSTGASSTAADEPPKASGLVLLLWFLIALGNMAPWTAMMSFLGVFKAVFGPAIFLKMNAAYYGPALPVLIMQIQFSPAIDRKFGSYRGFLIRAGLNTLILVATMAFFPLIAGNGGGEAWVLICSFLIGVFGGMAYGSVFSFNALFSKQCAAIFSMGLFAPGFVFLFFHLAISFSPPPPAKWKSHAHWYVAAGLTAIGLVAFLVLLNTPFTKKLLRQADEDRRRKDEQTRAKAAGDDAEDDATAGLVEKTKEATLGHVARLIGICLACIFFSIFAIVSITCFFTKVPSDGLLGASLPVTMFYVKNSTDFLGRCFTLLPLCIKSQKSLGVAVLARFLLVPLFFWYALAPPFGSDLFILGVVAISGVTSGYLNTCCFVLAGKEVRAHHKSKAAGLMNLIFQASLLCSIGFGFVVIALS